MRKYDYKIPCIRTTAADCLVWFAVFTKHWYIPPSSSSRLKMFRILWSVLYLHNQSINKFIYAKMPQTIYYLKIKIWTSIVVIYSKEMTLTSRNLIVFVIKNLNTFVRNYTFKKVKKTKFKFLVFLITEAFFLFEIWY